MDKNQKILKQILNNQKEFSRDLREQRKEQKEFKKALKMQDKKIDAQSDKFQTALDAQGNKFQKVVEKSLQEQRKEFQMYIGVIAEDFESKGNYSASSPL